MWMTDSWLGRLLSAFTDYLLLNVMWLLACLPIVTAPASTAALFDVLRQRQRGDDPGVVGSFIASFRAYFWRALLLGAGWAVIAAVLTLDAVIGNRMSGAPGTVLVVVIYAALVIFAFASVALFPVLISFDAPLRQILRTTVLLPLIFPGRSLASLAVLGAAAVIAWAWPASVLLLVAVAAGLVQRLHRGAFQRVAERAERAERSGTTTPSSGDRGHRSPTAA